jgi:hypothetical protein
VSPLKFLHLATVLLLAWPGVAVADDAHPQSQSVTMTCERAQNQMQWGKTKAGYPTDPEKLDWTTNQKGKQSCAKLKTGIKIVKNVTSSYKEWHVVGGEKNCQAEADRHNKAIRGFEQEHIDDAAKVFNGTTDLNAKLSQVVKLEFCADNEEDAVKKGTAAINKVSEDARKSYQAMADKRDASGHVDTINCECSH